MQLKKEELSRAYRLMCTIRHFEEKINTEFMEGNIPGFVHLYSGQEASGVGVCMNLNDKDKICSTHRGHGHCIAMGCDIEAMMLEIFGKAGGLCGGKGGSMHIADLDKGMLGANAIVGGAPPLAIGAGLSAKVNKTGGIAVAFTGDGGSNQGTTFEALNMAVVLKLPVVFVFENNKYGEGTGHDYAVGSKDISGRAGGFGLPVKKVNGYDFFAVYEAMAEAAKHVRAQKGPYVIETECERYYGHFVGDPELYRDPDKKRDLPEQFDSLRFFKEKVIADGDIPKDEFSEIDQTVKDMINAAVQTAKDSPLPTEADLLTDVYVNY